MISKDELLEILNRARYAEEKSIPIYTKHMSSAIFWTGISESDAKKARAILNTLATESEGHRDIIDGLVKKIKELPQNAV